MKFLWALWLFPWAALAAYEPATSMVAEGPAGPSMALNLNELSLPAAMVVATWILARNFKAIPIHLTGPVTVHLTRDVEG